MLIFLGLFVCSCGSFCGLYKWLKIQETKEKEKNKPLQMKMLGKFFAVTLMVAFFLALALLGGIALSIKIGKTLPIHKNKIAEEVCGEYVTETYKPAFIKWQHNLIALPPQEITKVTVPKPHGEK